jgi:hypothetical protein
MGADLPKKAARMASAFKGTGKLTGKLTLATPSPGKIMTDTKITTDTNNQFSLNIQKDRQINEITACVPVPVL